MPVRDIIHVIPVNDEKEHICSMDCPCDPTMMVYQHGISVVHHSWDGRELFEEIDEILEEGHG